MSEGGCAGFRSGHGQVRMALPPHRHATPVGGLPSKMHTELVQLEWRTLVMAAPG